jgi:hypothetical protein
VDLLSQTTALSTIYTKDPTNNLKDTGGPDGAAKPEVYEPRFHNEA